MKRLLSWTLSALLLALSPGAAPYEAAAAAFELGGRRAGHVPLVKTVVLPRALGGVRSKALLKTPFPLDAGLMTSAPGLATPAVLETPPVRTLALTLALSVGEGPVRRAAPESLAFASAKFFDGFKLKKDGGVPVVALEAVVERKPLRLLITGPPASGKGTHAASLVRDFGVVHISAGELLREHAKTHPEVAETMKTGGLVDAALVLSLVKARLAEPDVLARGFLLDGFPRRAEEAAVLEEYLAETGPLDAAIALDAPEEVLLRRILARGRADDTETAFRERMRIHNEETVPALARFLRGSFRIEVDASGGDVKEIYERIRESLFKLKGSSLQKYLAQPAPKARGLGRIIPQWAPGEGKMAGLLFAWNFLMIGAYSIIGPVKNTLLVSSFGPTVMPWVLMASAAATGLAVWVYGRFTHLPRRTLMLGTLAVLAATLFGWWLIALSVGGVGWVSFAFSMWSDVFSIMAVTVLWSYANDVYTTGGAKRSFGLVAAGGTLGAIAGSLIVKQLALLVGAPQLLLIAGVLFAATLLVFALAERRAGRMPSKPAPAAPTASAPPKTNPVKTILASGFLSALALVVILERAVPDFANYLFMTAGREAHPTNEAYTVFQADFALWQNVAAFLVSVTLTGWLIKRLGVGRTMMGVGLTNFLGFLAFAFSPALGVVVAHNAVEGLQRYTTFRAAKEAVYTGADRGVIYKVKPFIEMFLYRFARFLSGGILLLLTNSLFLGLGPAWVAWAGAPLALLWVLAAWKLGRQARALDTPGPKP